MKVNASASEFRALVQELTGRDARSPPDPSRYRDHCRDYGGGGGESRPQIELPKNCVAKNNNGDDENDDYSNNNNNSFGMLMPRVEAKDMEWFEPFDEVDVFMAEMMMMEDVSALLQPAGALYESAQVDQVLRSLHAL